MSQLGARLHSHAAAKWPTAAEQRQTTKKSAQNVSQAATSTRVAPARITYTTPLPTEHSQKWHARVGGQGATPRKLQKCLKPKNLAARRCITTLP